MNKLLSSSSGASSGSSVGGATSNTAGNGTPAPLTKSKSSVLADILRRSFAPPWVEAIRDKGPLSKLEERRRKGAVSQCQLCNESLITNEPNYKKICRSCGAVVCRLCSAHVHIVGHVRRRYVCFKCVGEAAVSSGLIKPVVQTVEVIKTVQVPVAASNASSGRTPSPPTTPSNQQGNFLQRLWDLWGGWGDAGSSAEEEEEEDEEEGESDDENVAAAPSTATSTAPPQPSSSSSSLSSTSVAAKESADEAAMMAGADGDAFDGDKLQRLFESSYTPARSEILAVPFTQACCEIIKLMAGLGKVFEFAGSDMRGKLSIMFRRTSEAAKEKNVARTAITLQSLVERDIKNGTTHDGKKAQGASRTIVRLLWFLDFVAMLLRKLADSPEVDLKTILSDTYEETLAPRHVFILRRVVRSGLSLVPQKKHFIPKLGLESLSQPEQCAKLASWSSTVDVIRIDLWKFMKSKGLEELP